PEHAPGLVVVGLQLLLPVGDVPPLRVLEEGLGRHVQGVGVVEGAAADPRAGQDHDVAQQVDALDAVHAQPGGPQVVLQVPGVLRQGLAREAAARLQDTDAVALLGQAQRRDRPAEAGADHDDVVVVGRVVRRGVLGRRDVAGGHGLAGRLGVVGRDGLVGRLAVPVRRGAVGRRGRVRGRGVLRGLGRPGCVRGGGVRAGVSGPGGGGVLRHVLSSSKAGGSMSPAPAVVRVRAQPKRNAFIRRRLRLMNAAYCASSMPSEGAIGSRRWWATVWDSVYLRMPSEPCRRPSPESFMPPMGDWTLPYADAYPSLMLTVPVRSRAARSRPRRGFFVQTEEFRPYGVELTRSTASSSVRKR